MKDSGMVNSYRYTCQQRIGLLSDQRINWENPLKSQGEQGIVTDLEKKFFTKEYK